MHNSCGLEKKPRKMGGVVYLVALGIFAVAMVACGVGKAHVNKQDVAAGHSEMRTVDAASFPALWTQSGSGMEDVAELHLREELLLENYSWVDPSAGGGDAKVRIPIERAMELLAQRGLPVAAPAVRPTAPAARSRESGHYPSGILSEGAGPKIVVPLTNGFAPTSYDLDQTAVQAREPRR